MMRLCLLGGVESLVDGREIYVVKQMTSVIKTHTVSGTRDTRREELGEESIGGDSFRINEKIKLNAHGIHNH